MLCINTRLYRSDRCNGSDGRNGANRSDGPNGANRSDGSDWSHRSNRRGGRNSLS